MNLPLLYMYDFSTKSHFKQAHVHDKPKYIASCNALQAKPKEETNLKRFRLALSSSAMACQTDYAGPAAESARSGQLTFFLLTPAEV